MSFVSNNVVLTHQPVPIDKSTMLSVDSHTLAMKNENEVPSNDNLCSKDQIINQVWTKETFNSHEEAIQRKNYLKANLSLNLKPLKTTWTIKKEDDAEECDDGVDDEETDEMEFKANAKESSSPTCETPEKETASPSHHARRPMNAFLIFCKKHRPIVRQRFPHLENRGVTRILGEWWALLDATEKVSYTSLAKEYKDAFFSANPDFKWYKLPAPPLRTLNTRPVGVPKPSSPLASPTLLATNNAEFTPGKLADETQLGNLTSLMSCGNGGVVNSFGYSDAKDSKSNSFVNNNNNNVENESDQHKKLLSPICTVAVDSQAPKPIKKRKFQENFNYDDNKDVDFSVNEDDISLELSDSDQNHDEALNGVDKSKQENITQQELMNKVVDSMFPDNMDLHSVINKHGWKKSKQKSKETRKSGRSCKGKRYAEFMVEGKLLGNKQMKKISQFKVDVNNKFDNVLNSKLENMIYNKNETQTPKLDLDDMIKRLAERTNIKLEDINKEEEGGLKNGARARTQSENSEDSLIKSQSNFNLDLRIAELPCLSYEMFLQRKKDSKKRKPIRSKSESQISKTKVAKLCESNFLVGSKKRKNKNSITRLEKPRDVNYLSNFNNDLFGLATLAEVAANTEKIN